MRIEEAKKRIMVKLRHQVAWVETRLVLPWYEIEESSQGINLVFKLTWPAVYLQVILICVPFTFVVYILDSWPFGLILCKVSECAKDVSIGVSVFTLTALSADRFFAIVDPMRKLHATGEVFFSYTNHSGFVKRMDNLIIKVFLFSGGGRRATRFTIMMAALIWLLAIVCAIPASFSFIRVIRVNKDISFKVSLSITI